jgi:transposase
MKNAKFTDKQNNRYLAARLFEKDLSISEIARILGVCRQSVSGWHTIWLKEGEAGLQLKKPGLPSRLRDEQWKEVHQALLEGPKAHGYDTELWTLERVADLIQKITGIRYHPCYVWVLLNKAGWSCQKPQRQSNQRDEKEIVRWKLDRWPQIKKGH